MPTVLGLDMGEKRVGVAISDPFGTIAMPHSTLPFVGRKQILREVEKICQDYPSCELIVVGLPLDLSGKDGTAAVKIKEHVTWFSQHSKRSWEMWDERLTTQEAERVLIAADVSREKRKLVIDQLAAQRMLQCYLDFKRHHSPKEDREK